MHDAFEMLRVAKMLAEASMSPKTIINRSYYAMFYSVVAALTTIGETSKNHSGIISLFNLN